MCSKYSNDGNDVVTMRLRRLCVIMCPREKRLQLDPSFFDMCVMLFTVNHCAAAAAAAADADAKGSLAPPERRWPNAAAKGQSWVRCPCRTFLRVCANFPTRNRGQEGGQAQAGQAEQEEQEESHKSKKSKKTDRAERAQKREDSQRCDVTTRLLLLLLLLLLLILFVSTPSERRRQTEYSG